MNSRHFCWVNSMKDRKKPAIRFKGFTEDWEQRKLGDVVGITSGFMGDSLLSDGKYHLTRIETIADGIVDENRVGYSNEKPDDMYLLKHGDILYSNINSISHMGKVAKYQGNSPLYHAINLLRLQPENNINSDFLLYLLNIEKCRNWAKTRANQAVSQASINQSLLTTQEIAISSFEEQKKIGDYFRNLDNLITLHQRKYDKLVNVKKSMLEKMFPRDGKFVPDVRFSGFTEDWEQRKLGEVVDVCSGRDYKHLSEGDIPVYGTGGYMLSVNQALSYDEDAIGIGRKGTIDKPYVLKSPFWTVDTLFYAVPRDKIALNFAFDIFQNIDWKKKDESTGVPSLSKTAINEIDVLIPKYEEQHALGQFFNDIDNLITLHQRKLEKLKNIKKSCLVKMFI